jgi:hypothetical protein
MLNWEFFCFLWDDPIFNPTAELDAEMVLTDPSSRYVRMHREVRLLALEKLHQETSRLKDELAGMREVAGRAVWTWKQLIAHVPFEVRESVLIQGEVNALDPDFSFCKAIGME